MTSPEPAQYSTPGPARISPPRIFAGSTGRVVKRKQYTNSCNKCWVLSLQGLTHYTTTPLAQRVLARSVRGERDATLVRRVYSMQEALRSLLS